MSDGWDIVSEYADTVASMVETENELKREIDRLREELELQRKIDLQIIAEKQQLRGNLSLAEEGLANYAQEVECLRAALERIRQVRYGLEQGATDEERAEYWSALALEYRRIAAETLRPAQPQPAPHDAEG